MFKSLPGFREFYPEDCAIRNHIFSVWKRACRGYGFQEYDGPVLEALELFTAKSGDEIVSQLFSFKDQGERDVALRPELTPTLARMVGAKANALSKPIKWFNIGENFRYERPQKGRLRSFYQLNCDILGEASPKADAEVIALMVHSLNAFGVDPGDFVVRLSDRNLWVYLLESYDLGEDEVQQALGVVDKFERMEEEKVLEALGKILGGDAGEFFAKAKELMAIDRIEALGDFLKATGSEKLGERYKDWRVLMGYLEALGLGGYIKIDLTIVRGLAYYTGFVFEAFQCIGKGRALGGGGRYDHLVKKLGGPDLPAVGFAMGDVTLRDFLELKGVLPRYINAPQIYAVFSDESVRMGALGVISALRSAGYSVEYALKEQSANKQHKAASQSGAKVGLVFGEGNEVVIKNFETKEEQKLLAEDVVAFVQETL